MGTTRILIQLDLFGGAPSQVIDVPVPPPEPEPEPLEVIPVLAGQLDLLNARAVKLRPVMDLLADARFEDAVVSCGRIDREVALTEELRWFAAEIARLGFEVLATFGETHRAVLERLATVGTKGIATSAETGVVVHVARHVESLGPGARFLGALSAGWWIGANRIEDALQSLVQSKVVPSAACEARLLEAGLVRERDPGRARALVAEAFVIDPVQALETASRWPEADEVIAQVEEWELEPVGSWVACAGVATGAWDPPPLLDALPHERSPDVSDAFAKHLAMARNARVDGRIDLPARKAMAQAANPLFRALLAAGRV